MFFIARSYTGYTDEKECGQLGIQQIAVMIYHPRLYAVVNIDKHSVPMVECLRVYRILEKFHQQRDIDRCTEYLIKPL